MTVLKEILVMNLGWSSNEGEALEFSRLCVLKSPRKWELLEQLTNNTQIEKTIKPILEMLSQDL